MSLTHALTPLKAILSLHSHKPIDIEINKGDNIKDAVANIIQTHAVAPYLSVSVLSLVMASMRNTLQLNALDTLHTPYPIKDLRDQFITHYRANTLQYNTDIEQDIFPRAYHTLVHCPISSIFDTLLELEQNYSLAIQAHDAAREQELAILQARHAQDIEPTSGSSPSNMTHLFASHVEDMEVFQATWASDLLQAQQTQRQEYRDFVIELYREYQFRLASLTDGNSGRPEDDTLVMAGKKLDGKEIIATAAGRIPQWENKRDRSSIGSQLTGYSVATFSGTTEASLPPPVSSASTAAMTTTPTLSAVESTGHRQRQSSSASLGSVSQHVSPSPNEHTALARTRSSSQVEGREKQKTVKSIQDTTETPFVLQPHTTEQPTTLRPETPQKLMAAMQLHQSSPLQSASTPFKRSASVHQIQRPMISNASSPAHSRKSSWNEAMGTAPTSRRHSLQKMATSPSLLHLTGPGAHKHGTHKGWNPISFLQQQKQAMENTNLSSVRKLGGWLGKAMENLGIENDESDPRFSQEVSGAGFLNSQQLVESFTITLGTAQIKSTHNLRLLVADLGSDILQPPTYDAQREMAYKAQTATKLYTSNLSAVIVLVDLHELKQEHNGEASFGWWQYKTGKGSNKALFERCQHSTEFHFPDIESQLTTIEADFATRPNELQEGCFFITRHSNLPLSQTVFHLVVDSQAIIYTELSNRHLLMTGLRNILRLVTRFDISSLSIPLLLLPDRYLEQPEHYLGIMDHHQQQQHKLWLQKRGEVTMKCVKGFLIENSRSGKRLQTDENVFGGGMRNVEFILPSLSAIYTSHTSPTSPITASMVRTGTNVVPTPTLSGGFRQSQEVELAFQQFRTLLVHLFRTS
ncbi:hypothetical protein BDF14DRAFT_1882937 [Spinellus fusiger]|nr:hypothetical protein BDF14DRAFT_1882937 [Spinellus fusiger]